MKTFWMTVMTAWDRFWFQKSDPIVLSVIRVLAGAILFYTHLVWTFELESFFSSDLILSDEHNEIITGTKFAWSHFNWVGSFGLLTAIHYFALICMFIYLIGFYTRITSVISLLFTISYANRAVGATFGLDQINVMLTFYCAIGPSGAMFSMDRLLRKRTVEVVPTSLANVAIRLAQLHLCVIYLFAGTGKLLGSSWWNGEAIWGAMANSEYQTLDLTWLAASPYLINLITHVSLAWEASYVFLVWPKWTRPVVIGMAFGVHLGIGIAMGMVEFGLIMAIANLVFVSSSLMRRLIGIVLSGVNEWPTAK